MTARPVARVSCPMGCGATLVLLNSGSLICWNEGCPRPTAAEEILTGSTEHLVQLEPETFSIQHPLRERLDGDLFRCSLHAELASMDGPPQPPGRYWVSDDLQTWVSAG